MVRKKFAAKAASILMAASLAVSSMPSGYVYAEEVQTEMQTELAAVQADAAPETEAAKEPESQAAEPQTEAPAAEPQSEAPAEEAPADVPEEETPAEAPKEEPAPGEPSPGPESAPETEVAIPDGQETLETTAELNAGEESEPASGEESEPASEEVDENTISIEYANTGTGEEWTMDCGVEGVFLDNLPLILSEMGAGIPEGILEYQWVYDGNEEPVEADASVLDAYEFADGKEGLLLDVIAEGETDPAVEFAVSVSILDNVRTIRMEAEVETISEEVLYVNSDTMSAIVSSPYTLSDTILAILTAEGLVDMEAEDASAEGIFLDVLDESCQVRKSLSDKEGFSGMDLYNMAKSTKGAVYVLYDGTEELMRFSLSAGTLSANGMESKKLTLSRKASPSIHSVTYHVNGGTSGGGREKAFRGNGEAIGFFDMEDPSGGSGFTGWFTQAEGGERVFPSTVVTSDMDLYAHYAGGMNAIFDWGFPASFESENHQETHTFETEGGKYTLFEVPKPIRDGYYFLGWEGQDGKALHPAGKENTSVRMYKAKWSRYPLPKATYHVNDGSGDQFDVYQNTVGFYWTQSDGGREEIDPSDFSDKIFLGWYTGPDDPVYEYTEYSCACGRKFKSAEEYQKHAEENIMDAQSHSYSMREVFSGPSLMSVGEPLSEDTDLYAHWSEGVTVTYDAGGAQGSYKPITVLKGKSIRKSLGTSLDLTYVMPKPAWSGHEFSGWFTPDGEKADIDTVFDEDTTLSAKWDTLTFTVTFDPGKDALVTGGSDTVEVEQGKRLTTLPSAVRPYYEFDGWYTSKTGGSLVTVPKAITGDVTFYAHWTQGSYTVTYNAGIGYLVSGDSVVKVSPGGTVDSLPEATANGMRFLGWFLDKEGTEAFTEETVVTKSITVYALYEELDPLKQAIVTFDANGGETDGPQRTVSKGSKIGPLPEASREGYRFAGWYTIRNSGVRISEDTIVSADTTFYAHWLKAANPVTSLTLNHDTLEVSFGDPLDLVYTYAPGNADNAEFYWTSSDPDVIKVVGTDSFQYVAGGTATLTVHTVDNAMEASCIVTVTKPQVLVTELAFDEPYQEVTIGQGVELSVTYGPKGAENAQFTWSSSNEDIIRISDDGQAWIYGGETGTVEITIATVDGSIQASCTIKVNPKEEPPKEDPDDPTLPVETRYTVSFDSEGGSKVAPVSVLAGETLSPLPSTTKDGYTFLGWFLPDGTKVESVTPGYDLTLYARWQEESSTKPVQYEVSFLPMNGEGPIIKAYAEGTAFGTLPGVSRDGYTFLGWFTSITGGERIQENTTVSGNQTVYAQWKKIPQKFTLTLDPNGGQADGSSAPLVLNQELAEGEASGNNVSAHMPQRQNHTFAGWADQPEGGVLVYNAQGACIPGTVYWQEAASYTGGKDLYLYAQWVENRKEYTLTFDARGGKEVAPVSYPEGTVVTSFPAASRDGYTFLGWSLAPTAGETAVSLTMDKAYTLYAQWVKEDTPAGEASYTITFDACGGTAVPADVAKAGENVSLPGTSRDGYTFLGWFSSQEGGTRLSSLAASRDMVLYAHWEEIAPPSSYTVTFDYRDGRSTQADVKAGVEYSAFPHASRDGYTFLGWFTQPEGGEKRTSAVVNSNMVFYAHWEQVPEAAKKEYTISFDPCGGSQAAPITGEEGTRIDVFPISAKEGYTFLGWFTQPENGRKVSAVVLRSNVTLYAMWESNTPVSYTLTFDFLDGKEKEELQAGEGVVFDSFPERAREGYRLLGWSLTKDGKDLTSSLVPDKDLTFYAVWEKLPEETVSYTLSFDANGGNGVPSQKVEKGTRVTVFPETSREGYVFAGWYTRAEGGFKAASVTVRSDITLYAHWDAKTKPVTLLELNHHELSVKYGTSPLGLSFKYAPAGASNAEFTWTSSNPSVIAIAEAVDAEGKTMQTFKYKGTGKTVLTISTKDGAISDSCTVTVASAAASGSGSSAGAGSSGSWNGAGSSQGSGDGAGEKPGAAPEAPEDTIIRFSLSVTTETGARKNVGINSNVKLSALAEKLGYDVAYFAVGKDGAMKKLDTGITIGEALEGTGNTLELMAYMDDGTKAGTVTVKKTGSTSYSVKITAEGQEEETGEETGKETDPESPEDTGSDAGSLSDAGTGTAQGGNAAATGSSGTSNNGQDAAAEKVQTSDLATIYIYGGIAAVMAAVIILLAVWKKRKKNKGA